jgi:hypothetical protein
MTFGAALAALGGSIWAAVAGAGCSACQDARSLVAGWPLAWIGVALYALISLLSASARRPAWTQAAFFAASGTHLVLLLLLLRHRLMCPPCIFTALAAWFGAAVTLAARRPGILALASLAVASSLAAIAFAAKSPPAIDSLPPVEPGHVRLRVYERPDCYECQMFEAQMVPQLLDEFGGTLVLARFPAPQDMSTPTLVIEGRGKQILTGLPAYDELKKALHDQQIP